MRLLIRHQTTHHYAAPASQAVLALRLTPRDTAGQRVVSWTVEAPDQGDGASYVDAFGNLVTIAAVAAGHSELVVTAHGVVETSDCRGIAGQTGEAATPEVFLRETAATKPDTAIHAIARKARQDTRLGTMHALMSAVHAAVAYRTDATDSRTTAAEALAAGAGVCQDHAHIMLAAARSLGIPARYVTGYLLLEGQPDAAAHHAWVEAEIDTLGWVGFDAANDLCPTDHYVRLATGLDAAGAAPIRGIRLGGADEQLHVRVSVISSPE